MRKWNRSIVAVVIAGVFGMTLLTRPASADDLVHQRDKVQHQRDQLKVQINLALSSDQAIQREDGRLAHLISGQVAAIAAAELDVTTAQSRAADAQRRLDDVDRHAAQVHKALVARAVHLYEHPFQDEALAIDGAASLNDYVQRQGLIVALQGRTSDILDAYRQQRLDEVAARKAMWQAQKDADARRALLQAQQDNLAAAKAAADRLHATLRQRIANLQSESSALAAQEQSLEAKLAAAQAALASSVPAGPHGPLIWPLHGAVTQEFGKLPGGFHPGIDIAAPFGTPIHASGDGVVIFAGWEAGYGNYTCISHGGGISTCYGHQSAISVQVGQSVRQGQVIGLEGSTGNSTGPHVHFEVRLNNVPQNPRAYIGGNP